MKLLLVFLLTTVGIFCWFGAFITGVWLVAIAGTSLEAGQIDPIAYRLATAFLTFLLVAGGIEIYARFVRRETSTKDEISQDDSVPLHNTQPRKFFVWAVVNWLLLLLFGFGAINILYAIATDHNQRNTMTYVVFIVNVSVVWGTLHSLFAKRK